jgi:hypothetical protein
LELQEFRADHFTLCGAACGFVCVPVGASVVARRGHGSPTHDCCPNTVVHNPWICAYLTGVAANIERGGVIVAIGERVL